MKITKENVSELVKSGKLSNKLYEQFIRFEKQEMWIPEVKSIEISGVEEYPNIIIDADFGDLNNIEIGGADIKYSNEYSAMFREIRFGDIGISRKGVIKIIKENKLWENAKSQEEFSKIAIEKYQDEIAKLFETFTPFFYNEKISDVGKVSKLLQKEHLDFLDFAKCDEYLEKNKKFFEMCEDTNSKICYVSKDVTTDYYDLLCVVKDSVPLFIPVPVVARIMGLEITKGQDFIVVKSLNDVVFGMFNCQMFYHSESEEFLDQFKTFFELRNL